MKTIGRVLDVNTQMAHDVICPHCQFFVPDSWEYKTGIYECPNCKKHFYVELSVEVYYSTYKVSGLDKEE